jgi:hypothetical protein
LSQALSSTIGLYESFLAVESTAKPPRSTAASTAGCTPPQPQQFSRKINIARDLNRVRSFAAATPQPILPTAFGSRANAIANDGASLTRQV